ncbi:Glycine dehydrogenase (decarboxylating) [invertebrate metagenome]|uniref:glycine dehydrogenase (aminomethyl-transferring) n=1 Tax=invertebrate metagenome TaxID=1711999 RepID=A0A2H9T9Y1_9ZZZZ
MWCIRPAVSGCFSAGGELSAIIPAGDDNNYIWGGYMAVDKSLTSLVKSDVFAGRHIGPDVREQQVMLETLGMDSLQGMMEKILPRSIQKQEGLNIASGLSEKEALSVLREIAEKNRVLKSCIGMGYYNTVVPPVVQRNVLENPGWYTAYTPYQAEISQGRLEGLLTFQQMVIDLTGMDIANASLLDEATAAAEAMALCRRSNRSQANRFFVAEDVHPQTMDVLRTRAEFLGIELVVDQAVNISQYEIFGALVQYPGTYGNITDLESIIQQVKQQKALLAVATDLLSLMLLKSPGELGADIALGSSQRFGVPMGFGGPHAAFFAARDKLKRSIPGRIIGVSIDSRGNRALRMAMQTREQHIRREKATSNICTAQALLANMAAFYAVYHGPEELKTIAERVHRLTTILADGLAQKHLRYNESYFDTLMVQVGDNQNIIIQRALAKGYNLRIVGQDRVGISLDETTTPEDVENLFSCLLGDDHGLAVDQLDSNIQTKNLSGIDPAMRRQDAVLQHAVFKNYHSETAMLRYLKRLENKDYSLVHGMIPLGSCTMKLNATTEMIPLSWPEFSQMHPFAPLDQTEGYRLLISHLEKALADITGYDAVSMQPNAGAQGEYSGLLAIRRYQKAKGEDYRNICLIPSSAHGTNPASAVMAGLKTIIVACDEQGNVCVDDLRQKAEENRDHLSALMITYPSTHGVFEEAICEICDIIHRNGGQVYLDGANMNAMVGVVKPGLCGSDVSHLNLHKTFAIPHGGGGPGMGPIGVKQHLADYLPGHRYTEMSDPDGAVSAAPFGSASILPISWLYITMLGKEGLRQATEVAILNANYVAHRLSGYYPILYHGLKGQVAHECIIDIRPIKEQTGVTEEDIAKRLMDYGFHAPTMSFPVAGTLMIEPTESESQQELDRFVEALVCIRSEIQQIEEGVVAAEDSALRHAPHTMADMVEDQWNRAYSRKQAVFPGGERATKYWPTSNRIDNVYGDRHFSCTVD